ncbi:Lrp/AsnC ligand binding domain-containing protein [Dasania marina]|uniref:Lrp/AsnC ligand binding domain-containing protein n=1 Tax=Dasania marina TaxID=471499 RepID=UPI00035CB3A2|nr:Lrp/AsnC ligand binding domain-containing protein [Dasania marina]
MSKTEKQLDRIDQKILDTLQRNGKIANCDLAELVHLSPSPCLERVRRLEKRGYIKEYVAHLNPELLDAALVAYIEVSLKRTATEDLNKFNQKMRDLDEVVECVMVAGGFDYLIKIRTENMQSYRHFLGEKLAAIEGVAQTHTYAVMEEVKSTHIIPVVKPGARKL